MKIAAKEASETLYWLVLCERSEGYSFDMNLKEKLVEINKILSRVIATTKGITSFLTGVLLYLFSNFQIFKLAHYLWSTI
jgi:hypothetical protein